jgi:hypothetical protein
MSAGTTIRLIVRYVPLLFRAVNGGAEILLAIAVRVLMELGLVLGLVSFAGGFEPG